LHFGTLEELAELRERNILLLLIDGTAIFGRVGRIDDCVVSIVPPVGIPGLTLVQFRPPNPTQVFPLLVSQLFVDICDIAHIVEGPFLFAPLTTPFLGPAGAPLAADAVGTGPQAAPPAGPQTAPFAGPMAGPFTAPTTGPQTSRTDDDAERQQWELICELRELEGQNVALATLGGWIIAGQLGDVHECISVISAATTFFPPFFFIGFVTIFGPVFPGGFTVFGGTFRVWTNLRALTTVVLP
jgi:hypothetical protein